MSDSNSDRSRTLKIFRWSARIISTVLASLWGFFVVVSIIHGPLPEDPESLTMSFLILLSIAGVCFAWFRELHGGIALLVVGFMHCVNAIIVAGHHKLFAVFISGVPFIIAGILFLASYRASMIAQVTQNEV